MTLSPKNCPELVNKFPSMTQAALPQKSQWQIRTPFGVISSDISHNIFVSFFLRELVVGGQAGKMLLLKRQQGGWDDGRNRVWVLSWLHTQPLLSQYHLAWGHFLACLFSLYPCLPAMGLSREDTRCFPYSSDLWSSWLSDLSPLWLTGSIRVR